MHRTGIWPSSVGTSLSHSTGNLRSSTLLSFRKVSVSKTFVQSMGISLFTLGNILSHSTAKLLRRSLVCVRYIPNWMNFMQRCGKSRFSVGNNLSHSTKKLSRWPFYVSEYLQYRKIYCIRGRYHDFCRCFFVS